VYIQRAKVSL